jgi:hypothetical protein
MLAAFDVFRTDDGNHVFWVGAVQDIDTATERVRTLGPGRYIVVNQNTGDRSVLQVDAQGNNNPQKRPLTR